jgi:hypothetical protein
MQTKTIPAGETPELVLNLRRNLILKGAEDAIEIVISTRDEAKLQVEQHAGKVLVDCDKDVQMTVPVATLVRLQRVRGNAELSMLQGDVDIDRVGGNLRLEDINTSHIHKVEGNLEARKLGAAFSCEGVGGNATVIGAACPIELNAGGNLELKDVPGKVSGNAGGDVRLTLILPDDAPIKVNLNAGGQAWLDVTGGDDIRMNVTAGGNIDCRLPEDVDTRINIASGQGIQNIKLGEGTGLIELACGGNVNLLGIDAVNDVHSWEHHDPKRAAKSIKLGEKRTVVFEVGIDLKIEGYDGDEVVIERGADSVQDVDGEIHVEAGMGCRARVPNNTAVRAEVGVDVQVRDFEGELNLNAGASARVKNFVGVAHVEAGAEANVTFTPTGDSKIEAGADVRCWIPEDASVIVNLSDMRGERTETFGDGAFKLDLTAGVGVRVRTFSDDELEGEGVKFGYDSERGFVANISPDIEKQILEFTSQMTSAAAQLSEGVSTIPMPDWLKGEVSDMHRRVEEATRRAQERIARRIESATRRAERKSQKTSKRVKVSGDFDIDLPFFKRKIEFNTDFPRPPMPPEAPMPPMPPTPPSPFASAKPADEPAREPVGDAERMAILRMLEQKKITAEQAAQLLAAMGA